MESHQVIERTQVVAVILGPVVEHGAIRTERSCDPDPARCAGLVLTSGVFRDRNRGAERVRGGFGRSLGVVSDLLKTFRGNLVTGGQEAIGSGLEVLAMHLSDGL